MKERKCDLAVIDFGGSVFGFRRVVVAVLLGLAVSAGVVRANAQAAALSSGDGPTFVVEKKQIPKHWSLIAYGDTRFTNQANTTVTSPKVRQWLVQRIAEEHPDALMISGDLPYDGSNGNDYDVFRKETAPWRAAGLRVFPALGNHELAHDAAKGIRNWWAAFPELRQRRWYSVEFGDAYILTLDSTQPLTPGSEQGRWAENQLRRLPEETRFVFVQLHHPPVADKTPPQTHEVGANERSVADLLETWAPKMKAKIVVIAGHTHNYERFEEGGVVFLVSGGGGAKPYVVPRDANDLYKNAPTVNYHYIKFKFDGERLKATMYRVDGDAALPAFEAKDEFSVTAAR